MESTQKFFLVSCICLCFLTPCTREEWIVGHIKHPHLYVQSHTAMPPSLPADLVKPSISLLPEPAITNNNGSLSNSTRIFNVQSFGAVGDTVTDDTQAFKSAWEMACQVKSAILLVPHGYSFMIQPMIFAGPCRNGLTFQVHLLLSQSRVRFNINWKLNSLLEFGFLSEFCEGQWCSYATWFAWFLAKE